jgi:hypothetical protein
VNASRCFGDEFKRALASILERPNQWPLYLHGTRRVILKAFPFAFTSRVPRRRKQLLTQGV